MFPPVPSVEIQLFSELVQGYTVIGDLLFKAKGQDSLFQLNPRVFGQYGFHGT